MMYFFDPFDLDFNYKVLQKNIILWNFGKFAGEKYKWFRGKNHRYS